MAGVDPEHFDLMDPIMMLEVIDCVQNFDPEEPLTEDDAIFIN